MIENADGNRSQSLAYPFDIIDDNVPPNVTHPGIVPIGNVIRFTWSTNEFAACSCSYFQHGGLLGTLEDADYYKSHERSLAGLDDDAEFHVEVQCTDLSGNASDRFSMTFELDSAVPGYLPFLSR